MDAVPFPYMSNIYYIESDKSLSIHEALTYLPSNHSLYFHGYPLSTTYEQSLRFDPTPGPGYCNGSYCSCRFASFTT